MALHNNGYVNNLSKSITWRISTVICTVCTVGTRLCCTHNRNVQPMSMNWIWGTSNQRTAGTCRCMTAGTKEELLEDAAHPAPPLPNPCQAAHHHRRLPATACHRLRFLTEFDKRFSTLQGPKPCSHVGDSPAKRDLNTHPSASTGQREGTVRDAALER